jgi:predicted MPP superfamily phosphohydrolase
MRRLLLLVAGLSMLGVVIVVLAVLEARSMPVVRRATVELRDWPEEAPPITVALISDLHVGNVSTDEDRLARVVSMLNALRPDLVLIAGDFIAGHEPTAAAQRAPALAALKRLRARLGTVAVPGNHDHWTGLGIVRRELARAGVTVLTNDAVRRGPVVILGVDDTYTHHDDLAKTLGAAAKLTGPRLLLSHSPDVMPRVPREVPLVLAGHTHCGQIVLPLIGAPSIPSEYGKRYACGIVRESGHSLIVTGGIGTSVLPIRWNAPPDAWLLTLRAPPAR